MGWQKRAGKSYYYRSVKERGRVRTLYFGAGRAGQLAAAEDQRIQECRATDRQLRNELRMELEPISVVLAEFRSWIDSLLPGVLVIAGFYCHSREWRRRVRSQKAKPSANHDDGNARGI